MPEVLEAPAPAAAPAAPTATPSPSPAPLIPDRSGSMDRSRSALRNIGKPKEAESAPKPATHEPAPKPEKQEAPKPAAPETAPKPVAEADKGKEAPKPDATAKAEPKDWPLFNKIKTENQNLKKQLEQRAKGSEEAETLKQQLETHRKELETEREARKKAEEILRFQAYQHTKEFTDQYQVPYEAAWSEAINNLKGIKLTDDSGTERDISRADIQALSDMEIDVARATIKKLIPDTSDASEVRRHVDNVRSQTNRHKAALEKAWTDSEKWQKEQQANYQKSIEERDRMFKTVQEENAAFFQQINEEDTSKNDFLKPKDNDEEWNQRLERGKQFVNESLSANPNNPKLSKEQRQELMRRSVAVINRAIAFGPQKLHIARLEAKLAEAEKKLAGYQDTAPTPGNGKGKATTTAAVPAHPLEAARGRLRSGQYV